MLSLRFDDCESFALITEEDLVEMKVQPGFKAACLAAAAYLKEKEEMEELKVSWS